MSRSCVRGAPALLAVACLLGVPAAGLGQSLTLNNILRDPNVTQSYNSGTNTTAAGLTSAFSTGRGVSSGSAGYGSASAEVDISASSFRDFALGSVNAGWTDSFTITSAAGTTARLTYALSGITWSHSSQLPTVGRYTIDLPNGASLLGTFDNGGTAPQLDQLPSSFVCDLGFASGSPTSYSASVGAAVTDNDGRASGHVALTLRQTGLQVLDAAGNPTAYTLTSRTGNAQATPLTAGTAYSSIAPITNHTDAGRLGTTVRFLGGTAAADGAVTQTFLAPTTGLVALSDVVDIQGHNGSKVAVEISYNEALRASLGINPAAIFMASKDANGNWVNTVTLNSDAGAGSHRFDGAYDPNDPAENVLGAWGVDPITHTVWAVIDHNSEFALTPVPEPVVCLLAAVAGLVAVRRLCRG